MNADDVTRPRDLADVPLRELLDAWHAHTSPLVDARYGIREPLPPARLQHHALGALATGQALADQLMRMRWVTVAEALAYGATVRQVAAACGFDEIELTAGLRSWADGQTRERLMTPAQRDEVLGLIAGWFE